jgi:hypothetical protein
MRAVLLAGVAVAVLDGLFWMILLGHPLSVGAPIVMLIRSRSEEYVHA